MKRAVVVLLLVLAGCGHDDGAGGEVLVDVPLGRAAAWLWSQQAEDGGWHSETYGLLQSGQSLTPFMLDALLDVPEVIGDDENERIGRAVHFIRAHVDDDGALGRADPAVDDYPNYATALAATVLARLGGETELMVRLGTCLLRQQFSERSGWQAADAAYGAWGMGGPIRRPPDAGHLDLSMTRYALEALAYQPRDERSAATQRALRFLERVQQRDARGFIFSTVMTDKNKAGPREGGGFRPYGTATADGVLALHAIGLYPDHPMCTGALDWLVEHHRTDRVPGFPANDDGWSLSMRFYYLAAGARAFKVRGVREAPKGRDWRVELVGRLAAEQGADGSFRNAGTLMKEDDPLIATALAIKALAATR